MKLPLLITLLASTTLACSTPARRDVAEAFVVASPVVTTATVEREHVGEIHAVRRVELRARVKGYLEAVKVDEGQAVRAGDLLFSIGARELQHDQSKARAATQSAAAELKAARLEQGNMRLLFEKKIIADAEMAQMDAKVLTLEAKLEEARANEAQATTTLGYASIRAPFDGVINRLPRKIGSLVGEDDLLTTLTDTSEVFVYFRLPEAEYLRFTATQHDKRPRVASLLLANGELYPEEGVIDAVETEFDASTGNIAFRARFTNPKQILKHGGTAKVVLKSELGDALLVPQTATFEVQDQLYVYTVDQLNTVHARRITPRMRLKDAFVVESGLASGERFIVEGIQRAREGQVVTVRDALVTQHSSL